MSKIALASRSDLRKASVTHARKLIKGGDVKTSARWSGPSAGTENAYIDERGFLRFADWFLGIREEAPPDTKERFSYPFTDDFKTISTNGLKAIRSRSAQNGETEIFEEAGRLIEMIGERDEAAENPTRITFQMRGGSVDREAGMIEGVSIIEAGEARGHRMMISGRTLDSVENILAERVLPAYISHNGAQTDRLMEEVGAFSEFYRAGDKIRAGRFEVLPSFREHEPERFDRLFDLAELMPATFGISIVFEGSLFWETDEADVPFDGFTERPEGAEHDLPTIEPNRIFSADFVDTPAATASLFTEKPAEPLNDEPKGESMNAQIEKLDESASAELERRRAADEAEETAAAPTKAAAEAPKKKAKAKKKALDEEAPEASPEESAEESAPEAVEESAPEAEEAEPETVEASAIAAPELLEMALDQYRGRIAERDILITNQSERIDDLTVENRALRRALGGAEEIEEEAETTPATSAKESAIQKYLEENPSHNLITATLEVGKSNPTIFNN